MIKTGKVFSDRPNNLSWSLIYSVVPSPHLVVKAVDNDADTKLNQEQGAQDPGVGGGESMVFIDGAAAATEGDAGGDEANDDQEDRDGVEAVTEEVKILAVCHLDDDPGNYKDAPKYLNNSTLLLQLDTRNGSDAKSLESATLQEILG